MPDRDTILRDLSSIDGVSPFPVKDATRLGVLIEDGSLDGAMEILASRVARTCGVLGTWPVFSHDDPHSKADLAAHKQGLETEAAAHGQHTT
jgi:hypothetical protein